MTERYYKVCSYAQSKGVTLATAVRELYGYGLPNIDPSQSDQIDNAMGGHGLTGADGEMEVARWLRTKGLKAQRISAGASYDIACEGKRVEVKTARFIQRRGHWLFKFTDPQVKKVLSDVTIIRLEEEELEPVHLVVPTEILRTRISPTGFLTLPRSLGGLDIYKDRLDIFQTTPGDQ